MNLQEFEKAVTRLEEALAQPKNEFIRDSVIQRFEFCVELGWKTSAKILGLSSSASRDVVRDMARAGVIRSPELWFDLIDARNEASHTYKEAVAEKVYSIAKNSIQSFKNLIEELKKR